MLRSTSAVSHDGDLETVELPSGQRWRSARRQSVEKTNITDPPLPGAGFGVSAIIFSFSLANRDWFCFAAICRGNARLVGGLCHPEH